MKRSANVALFDDDDETYSVKEDPQFIDVSDASKDDSSSSSNEDYKDNKFDGSSSELSDNPVDAGGLDDGEPSDIKIERFDMVEEEHDGVIDQYGNYIQTVKDKDESFQDQDQWITDFKDSAPLAAAAQKRIQSDLKQLQLQNRKTKINYTAYEALLRLQYFIARPADNVLYSLGRLNKLRKKHRQDNSNSKYVIQGINLLTDIITLLEQKQFTNLYELDREAVSRLIQEEALSPSEIPNSYQTKQWHFQWLNDLGTVHGPYTDYEMNYWKYHYFDDKVIVAFGEAPCKEIEWVHVECVEFSRKET